MRSETKNLILDLLQKHPEGMTLNQISEAIGKSPDLVSTMLYRTYGLYIKSWVLNQTGFLGYVAVWACVAVPESAVKPKITADLKLYHEMYQKQHKERIKQARNARLKAMREKAKEANTKMRTERNAQRAAERAERQRIKEELRAEKERLKKKKAAAPVKVEAEVYQPKMTRWAFTPPWLSGQGAAA